MRKWILIVAVAALLALPGRGWAWNNAGHMTVALLAWKELTPEQQKQVSEILKTHPHYKQLVLDTKAPNVDEGAWAFMKFATWPDWVRPARPGGADSYKTPAITRYHRGEWHYINMPYFVGGYHGPATKPSSGPANILTALADNRRTFGTSSAKAEDRAVALAWLEHLVGDLHQPCHAATMYSERFPMGDKGANDQMVASDDGPKRVHAYWDDLMGKDASYADVDALTKQLAAKDDEKLKAQAKDENFQTWAKESHDLAIKTVYLNGDLKTALSQDWEQKKIAPDKVPAVPAGYHQKAREVAEVRVLLAGHRLAAQVAEALAH
jgi:hypothetical protein